MNDAYCEIDGTPYTADQFASLSPMDIAVKRKALTCVECDAKAFYRRESSDGKSACFGILGSHRPGCDYFADEIASSSEGKVSDGSNMIRESESVLNIDFNPTHTKPVTVGRAVSGKRNSRGVSQTRTAHNSGQREHKWKLPTLLRNLIMDPEYIQSGVRVRTSSGLVDISSFCLSFSSFSERDIKAEYICWGRVTSTYYNQDKKLLFLNSSTESRVNIGVSGALVDVVAKKAKLGSDYKMSQEFYIILHSKERDPFYSSKKRKWTLWINDPNQYAISTNRKLL